MRSSGCPSKQNPLLNEARTSLVEVDYSLIIIIIIMARLSMPSRQSTRAPPLLLQWKASTLQLLQLSKRCSRKPPLLWYWLMYWWTESVNVSNFRFQTSCWMPPQWPTCTSWRTTLAASWLAWLLTHVVRFSGQGETQFLIVFAWLKLIRLYTIPANIGNIKGMRLLTGSTNMVMKSLWTCFASGCLTSHRYELESCLTC